MRDKYFTLEDVKPSGEKNARIRSILQPRYSSRSIIHPKDLNGLGALELELLKFPNGKHDDLIDAMSSALSIAQVNNVRKQTIITPNYI
jgi:phage terminase large subunit-like protein